MIIMLVLSGCTSPNPVDKIPLATKTTSDVATSVITSTTSTTKYKESPSDTEARLVNQNWVSPAEINIGNYYAGARAEWKIKVHNGNDAMPQYESYRVGTEPNETIAPIKIKLPLAGNDYTKVNIISDNTGETLIATGYNSATKEVMISGFLPLTTRIITISYIAWTAFAIEYNAPTNPREGYSLPPAEAQDWVIIADATPVLAPKETREILVTLGIPKEATVTPIQVWYLTDKGKLELKGISLLADEARKLALEKPENQLLTEIGKQPILDKYLVGSKNLDILIEKGYVALSDVKKWEYQIGIMEQGQGNLQLAYSIRWLVVMR